MLAKYRRGAAVQCTCFHASHVCMESNSATHMIKVMFVKPLSVDVIRKCHVIFGWCPKRLSSWCLERMSSHCQLLS